MGGVGKNPWPEETGIWRQLRDAFLAPPERMEGRCEFVIQQRGEDSGAFDQRVAEITAENRKNNPPGFHMVYFLLTRPEAK